MGMVTDPMEPPIARKEIDSHPVWGHLRKSRQGTPQGALFKAPRK